MTDHATTTIPVAIHGEEPTRSGRPIDLAQLHAEMPASNTLQLHVGKFDVRIHHTDEGVAVEVWDRECQAEEPLATTYAFDNGAGAVAESARAGTGPRFAVGDRVQVVRVDSCDSCDPGQIGTVLDHSYAPWVRFDTPTRYPHAVMHVPGGPAGYCDCLNEDQLVRVTP